MMSDQKGYIIDLDGTVYLQDDPIPGAAAAINHLYQLGHKVCFFTNNPTKPRKYYYEKLKQMAIQLTPSDIISASYLSAMYFKVHVTEEDRIWPAGEPALAEELRSAGLPIAVCPEEATIAVLGGGPSFSFDHLNQLYQAYMHGAKIFATNPDLICPQADLFIPDTGPWIAAIQSLMKPEDSVEILGKPSANAAAVVTAHLGLSPHQCWVIGDRLDTDIQLAQQNGMHSVLVLTGVTSHSDLLKETMLKPDIVLTALPDLANLE